MAVSTRTDARTIRVALVREAVDGGAYQVDPPEVAEAIVHRLTQFDPIADDRELDEAPEPPLEPAPPSPSLEDLAGAQLNSYAIDLRRSYERELEKTRELEERAVATVRALASAVAERDDDTGNHIQRVHDLGLLLACAVIPGEADDPQLAYGFILHDIGKVAVPDAVLLKPGPLDDDEWKLMRSHAEAGARMLDEVPFLSRAREVVLHHHERWDGGGYPDGLAGEQIPLWARIFAVVDTVDAMTSDRPYRKGVPLDQALAEVADKAGSQFDPRCVESFLALNRRDVSERLQRTAKNRFRSLAA
jgi:ribonuclease P protein subunit RPR2